LGGRRITYANPSLAFVGIGVHGGRSGWRQERI
jgi:hypothetical protein